MKKLFKKMLLRSTAILCSVMLLILSPCAKYIGASGTDKVQATEIVLGYYAGEIAIDWLIALLASIGFGAVAYENRNAIASTFSNYIEKLLDSDTYVTSPEDTCIQIYNSTTDTVQNIPWQDFIDGMYEYPGMTLDNPNDIYVKYSPQLLNSFSDFTADVLNDDVYVSGLSDAIIDYTPVTADDVAAQWSGEPFNYSVYFENEFSTYTNIARCDSCISSNPLAACTYTEPIYTGAGVGVTSNIKFFYSYASGSKRIVSRQAITINSVNLKNGVYSYGSTQRSSGFGSGAAARFTNISVNFPLFSSEEAAKLYLQDPSLVTNAINYDQSMHSNISDNATFPLFYRTWQQEELGRLSNISHIGIGSYGRGTTADKWDNETPWISLASLRQYALLLLDIYNQVIHDILNGTYDSSEDVPNTYSDAWEQTISDAWDDVVEQSSEAGPTDGSKDDTNGEGSDKDKDKEDPDAPIEGEGTEKPGEGGGSDTDPPTEGENPDPKEPPEKDGNDDNVETPGIAKSAIEHSMKKHMPSKFALQLGYISKELAEAMIENQTFFNMDWTEEQVIEALRLGYEEALNSGCVSGNYLFTYLGETIIICLENGIFKTGYGIYGYTYEELWELYMLLTGGK